jgi:hypothetical protein
MFHPVSCDVMGCAEKPDKAHNLYHQLMSIAANQLFIIHYQTQIQLLLLLLLQHNVPRT